MLKKTLYIFLVLFPAKIFSANFVEQWPQEIVPNTKYLGYAGSPKIVRLHSDVLGVRKFTEQYEFNDDGLLKELRSNSPKDGAIVKRNKSGKIEEVIASSTEHGNIQNSAVYRPGKHDGFGRVTSIIREIRSSPSVYFKISDPVVIQIKYENRAVTYDTYTKRPDHPVALLIRERIEFDDNGVIQVICWDSRVFQACEGSKNTKIFGKHGPVRFTTDAGETTYVYEDGKLIEESQIERDPPKFIRLKYHSYELDECGNWIFRKVAYDDGEHQSSRTEERSITYHQPCKSLVQ